MTQVDLNSDLGESYGRYQMGNDKDIIPLITSANVACGFHAGDPDVLLATLARVKESGAGLGAHPSYPDRQGFGRRYMDLTADEVRAHLLYQIAVIDGLASLYDLELNHVKPHGALYNATFDDYQLALTIAKAVYEYNPKLKLMGLAGHNLVQAAEEVGLQAVNEVFADRAYEDDGTLVSRRKEGAVITDTDLAIKRVIRMVKEGKLESINGKELSIQADSICVHGDGAKALEFVQAIRTGLKDEDIEIKTI